MSGVLAEAVDQLVLSGDPDELTEILAIRDRLNAKLAIAVGECRANEWHRLAGFGSTTAMLKRRAGLTHRDATALSSLASKLRSLKVVADAWSEAALVEGQVKAIAAIVPARHMARFAEHEAAIVELIEPLSTAETVVVLRDWKARADAIADPPQPNEVPDELHVSEVLDGRVELLGSFDAEEGHTIKTAIAHAMSDDKAVGPARRRATALADICHFYLTFHDSMTGTSAALRQRPRVSYGVEVECLRKDLPGFLESNQNPIPAVDIQRVLCDCDLHRYVHSPTSALLDYGRSQRTAPDALFVALVARDGGCRGRNCDKPPQDC